MAEAEALILTITNAMATITNDVGPAASDAITFVYRVDAAKGLAIGVTLLLLTIVSAWITKSSYSSFTKNADGKKDLEETPRQEQGNNHSSKIKEYKSGAEQDLMIAALFSMITIVMGVSSMGYLLSPYYWMAIAGNPGPMIAKRALEAAGMV